MASHVDAVSDDKSLFLKKGTSAPYFCAKSAYSLESVDTCTSSNTSDCNAASIEYANNGFPSSSLIFLSFNPFEPLLAGITAKLRILLLSALNVYYVYLNLHLTS